MNFLNFKKAISPVVAVSLLLVVSVGAVVSFQGWFSEFSSTLLVDVEKEISSSSVNLNPEGIVGNNLYFSNSGNSNISINSILINGKNCNLNNKSIGQGLSKFNISVCIENATSPYQNLVVITENKIIEKTLYLDIVTPVSIIFTPSILGSLTGYSYNENLGYISFSGPGYGVDLNATLFTGFAYGENFGYISFNGTGYNVSLVGNTLVGYAYNEQAGYIHFNPSGIYGVVSYS